MGTSRLTHSLHGRWAAIAFDIREINLALNANDRAQDPG